MTHDERKTDYGQVAELICRKLAALKIAGWIPPFSVTATSADDGHIFVIEYDGERYVTTDDVASVLPDVKYPVAVTITDAAGGHCWIEIEPEDLAVQ